MPIVDVKVVKRDRTVEDFDCAKITRVAAAAGLDSASAQVIADRVCQWAEGLGKGEVTSIEIKNQVLVEIQKVDKMVASAFAWYEKTKEKVSIDV